MCVSQPEFDYELLLDLSFNAMVFDAFHMQHHSLYCSYTTAMLK